jgi:gliding motility-associated-like protein
MKGLLLIVVILHTLVFSAQNISGVVNSYYPATAINLQEATVSVTNSAGLTIGDTLLIIQMKGAQIDVSASDDYGDVTDYGGAGNYELVEICDIQGNDIILKTQLEKSYTADGLQLIGYTNYANPDVTGTVTCDPWDGSAGGVVVIKAQNGVTLSADIDVSELGFRGGTHFYSNSSCTVFSNNGDYEYDLASNLGGVKGEGIAEYTNMNCGKGALANGGGGGNDHNSGGAGGGNISAGGKGGDNDDPGTWRCKGYHPGLGGKALDYSSGRIFLGGGGGGGHSNSAPNPYDGGNGGGIVIIMADEIIGNGGSILANGGAGGDGIGDGGAGGGAGGSVLLFNNSFSGSLSITANGGDGGNGDGASSVTSVNIDRCFGPGGGGSGGFVWFNASTTPGGVTVNQTGGVSGVVSGSSHTPCLGLTQGAEDGELGVIGYECEVTMGRKINTYCDHNSVLDIGADTVLCDGETVTYTSNITGTYDWNTGETSSAIVVSATGTYLLIVDDGTYIYCDSAEVTTDAPQTIDIGAALYLCDGAPITISAPSGFDDYLWSTGATTSSINVSTAGEVWVEVGGQVCSSSDTVMVYNEAFTNPFAEEVMELCNEAGIDLDAGYPGANYDWSTGATTQQINVTEQGVVTVDIVTQNNCSFQDEVEIIQCSQVDIPNTITPNGDGANDTWIIRQIFDFPNSTVTIYDRSGRLVYSAIGYENDWDGAGLPATVYYYSIQLDADHDVLKGTITIIRE